MVDTVADTAARVFKSMGAFQANTHANVNVPTDPAFVEEDKHRRDALLNAVAKERPELTKKERARVAATLDILWGAPSYERLIDQWGFAPKEAMAVLKWAIDRVIADA